MKQRIVVMVKVSNSKSIVFQFIRSIGAIVGFSLLLTGFSCNRTKTNETPIVKQLNDSKFEKTHDQKNALYLVSAAEIYLREIKLGQLVQQKASLTDVRELGKMNEEFNTQQLISLINLAKIKSVSIPTSPNLSAEKTYERIANKSGNAFDKTYCDEMVSSQNKTIHFLEIIISETSDESIRDWATKALPEMHKYLSYAITCQRRCQETTIIL